MVTLPPGLPRETALAFARAARRGGADRLEVRTDLHRGAIDAPALARELPLLVAERGEPAEPAWLASAAVVDRPLGDGRPAEVLSLHAEGPLSPAKALQIWSARPPPAGVHLKHVEPLGDLADAKRLLVTQQQLGDRFGAKLVTVLATGTLALPFRCVLAQTNALDYVALDAGWSAAPGQRLLAEAIRERRQGRGGPRFGILGAALRHSRSPCVHRQPFDRIELPADTDLPALLAALQPWYAGFAVTNPFKRAAAEIARTALPAVNTLLRTPDGWRSANTDLAGAGAALLRLGGGALTILGEGGASVALREACRSLDRPASVRRRREQFEAPLEGTLVWTWPAHLAPPAGLRFRHARVGVIAYGVPGRQVADQIRKLGGSPVALGARWFVAQAREQRKLWGLP